MNRKLIYIIVLMSALFISGCENKYEEIDYPVRPPELNDCAIYRLSNSEGGSIVVVRCPNSTTSTTYPQGKTQGSSIVVDGVEYIPKSYE